MNLISFNNDQIAEVLKLLGVDNYGGYVGECNTCKVKLYAEDIGTIAKGKDKPLLYCDDADCFVMKVTKEYVKEKRIGRQHQIHYSTEPGKILCGTKKWQCSEENWGNVECKFCLSKKDALCTKDEVKE